ncbi:MAG: hypothetical protein HN793_02230 [Rhodospirillaceae bacterium]|jgi:hypothetical protein|nr:hypothetical protein [Rhodospirillaceae bacterium]MBT5565367.1 hypothetical protein [Rhodospirillaceae bacterium]MBT6089106.1 hypothetical protein [Rhodospirillaceae bacterium]MBT6960180.1 hypothetical protein [Rhodospirillaceae bacterium]MBT7449621.1 hypothetical protein [Rhodospirillaceae bacterium]
MPNQFAQVEPHGDLEQIIDDVWSVTGSVAFKPLVRLPRNMVVLRHNDELTLINSVRLDAVGEAALDTLGKVRHVMKIGFHGMDDAYYVDRYGAKQWSTDEGAGLIREECALPFPQARVFMFKDTVIPEAAILIEREGGLLITCDSVQHWVPKKVMSPLAKVMTRIIGFQKPAQIGPPWRKKQTPVGGSLRADFERLSELPFQRLIGGHGGLLERNGPGLLKDSISREL